MEMPEIVYHGTFWPEGTQLGPEGLKTDYGYVSTTPDKKWAIYFAMHTRWRHREQPGNIVLYEIDTGKLPQDVKEKCIPPDGVDPRVLKYKDDYLYALEEEMKKDRIKISDWRFPHIPLEVIVNSEEEHRDAQPKFNMLIYRMWNNA